jgi:hypothetical protein
MNLIDVTDAMGVPLWYDRSTVYGIPHATKIIFKGAEKLNRTLNLLGEDMKIIGWLDCVEKILTGGVYVDKPGAHREGIAVDFDGAILKQGEKRIFVYSAGMENSLPRKTATRFACLIARRFGVVLTEGYNREHEDHIHADLSLPVKWRNSKSQIVLVQEVLNAWFGAGLEVDGKLGTKTRKAWSDASGGEFKESDFDYEKAFKWLLEKVAFDPPIE